jgi:hypothetical protein
VEPSEDPCPGGGSLTGDGCIYPIIRDISKPPPRTSVFPVGSMSGGASVLGGGSQTDGVCSSVAGGFGAPFPGQHYIKSLEQ